MTTPTKIELARFGHNPSPVIDFLVEIEELEAIAANERLGLTGFGHEEDRASQDARIERALDFVTGGDQQAVEAKQWLRQRASERGFDLTGVVAYAGQPIPRALAAKEDHHG